MKTWAFRDRQQAVLLQGATYCVKCMQTMGILFVCILFVLFVGSLSKKWIWSQYSSWFTSLWCCQSKCENELYKSKHVNFYISNLQIFLTSITRLNLFCIQVLSVNCCLFVLTGTFPHGLSISSLNIDKQYLNIIVRDQYQHFVSVSGMFLLPCRNVPF